jgi:hypothetical protein
LANLPSEGKNVKPSLSKPATERFQELLAEAINNLFAKYHKPEIARAE